MTAQPNYKLNEKLTVEEYIRLEEENHQKYEYHDGQVYAMSGGSIPHSVIGGNIYGELYSLLKGKPCKPINNDMKLWIKSENSYFYPDGMIVCGDFKIADDYKDAITNPVVIFEVLSKSTGSYDRGDKFFKYRQISSLLHYVLIEQEKPQIDIFSRREDPSDNNNNYLWKITTLKGFDKKLTLELANNQKVEISLKDIYEGVEFGKEEDKK